MLDKDHIDVDERLKPMFMEAIATQSFGLNIVATAFISSLVQTDTGGMIWSWGLYYQASASVALISKDGPSKTDYRNNVAHMTMMSNPYATQDEINQIIADGCEQLREKVAIRLVQGSGGKS
jgi:hypothetical protein